MEDNRIRGIELLRDAPQEGEDGVIDEPTTGAAEPAVAADLALAYARAQAAERQDRIQTTRAMMETESTVSVRAFRAADREQVEQLWARVFPDDPPSNSPAVLIDTKLRVQPELFLIAVADGAVVGAVMAGFDGVRGWIHHLAVSPDHRRRGIATALVRAAESGLGHLGCPKVNLQVRATNSDVVAFYRQLGYGVEDRVSMGRRLEGAG